MARDGGGGGVGVERTKSLDPAYGTGFSSCFDEMDATRSSLLAHANGRPSAVGSRGGSASSSPAGDIIAFATGAEFAREKKKILILMSDTGGGHRASGEALRAAFDELYGGQQETVMVDFWTELAGSPFTVLPPVYSYVQRHPFMWKFLYWFGQFGPTRGFTDEVFNMVAHNRVRDRLKNLNADVIVSVHPMIQNLSLRVLAKVERDQDAPYVVVVTDFGDAHPMWFHEGVDACYVATEAIRKIALNEGLDENQLKEYGLPVRSDFWEPVPSSKDVVRERLGLNPGIPAVLIVSGGDGAVGLEKIAIAVADAIVRKADGAGQMVVVCGRNESARERLSSRVWGIHAVITGFISNMGEWMAACDCIVTKAGPGTIAEALIRGLPMVLSCYLPGQEEGNVDFVVQNQVGVYCPRSKDIGETVADWFADPEILGDMACRAKSLGRPQASREIVKDIWKVARNATDLNLGVRRNQLDVAIDRRYKGRYCGTARHVFVTYPARVLVAILFIALLMNLIIQMLHARVRA